ncbi:MAG TPA: metallophosphoesterase [Candidatus Nanoarchaeia archaeon]|nr:metallophosphoesterase [Candidatus Nanoarchaeia archaeon]
MEEKQKIIEDLFEKGILVSQDVLDNKIEKALEGNLIAKLEQERDLLVLNTDYVDIVTKQKSLVDWYEVDFYRVQAEKERDDELYQAQLQQFKQAELQVSGPSGSDFAQKQQLFSSEQEMNPLEDGENFTAAHSSNSTFSDTAEPAGSALEMTSVTPQLIHASPELTSILSSPSQVQIIISYKNEARKFEVKDFTQLFASRYRFLEGILRQRQELQNTMPISRLLAKKEKENVSLIALIDDISETKNGNLILTAEDLTGRIKVVFSKNKKDLYQKAKDLVLDEVVGISGVLGDKIIFGEEIVWPDIPVNNQLKKSEVEEYAIFLSDVHVGSKLFLKDEFNKFLRWINAEAGNPAQREIAQKVKYIIIAGDLVDGIGIYPSQQDELALHNIIHQYEEFSELIKKIPSDKQIIICPGNHDAVHLAEPQASFDEKFAPSLFKIPNVTLVTNPAMVNIARTETFPGFDVLLYHGYSFDYYVANVESIRNNGGYHRADLIMKFLLKRRHLAPSFKSTPYFPGHKEDPLLIKKIPDFLISGHIHYSNVANYKGVTTICGSCWQDITTFQEKLGHQPEPARVPLVNLKTREVKVLKFG